MDGNVDLGPQLEQAVADLVERGAFGSREELLREGVRMIQKREERRAEVFARIEEGIAQLDAGLGVPIEDVRARFIDRYRNWPAKDA